MPNRWKLALITGAMIALIPAPAIAAQATFNTPSGVAVRGGVVYVADYNAVRKIQAGNVTTLAGPSSTTGACPSGFANGVGAAARFDYVSAIAVGQITGNIYVTEHSNNTVRKITPAGVVTTLGGQGPLAIGTMAGPSVDGLPAVSTFNHPTGITIDATETFLYVNDSYDYSVRRIRISTGLTETIIARRNMNIPGQNGIGLPTGIGYRALTKKLYINEQPYGRIREYNTLLTGIPVQASTLPILSPATFALNHPSGIAVSLTGVIFVTQGNGTMTANNISQGTLVGTSLTTTIVAGSSTAGAGSVNNATGTLASFNTPSGIALNPFGTLLYIADQRNNKIRSMVASGAHAVQSYAGSGVAGCADGPV